MKKAAQLRVVMFKNVDLPTLHDTIALFLAGPAGMDAATTGVSDEAPCGQAALVSGTTPQFIFDGFAYVCFMFITSG